MKKPSIETVPKRAGSGFDKSVKESLEIIMGRRSGSITPLNADATISDVINKVNEIIDRLQ